MKKAIFLFGIILLVFVAFGYSQTVDQGDRGDEGPKIVIEPKSWDFGEVQRPAMVDQEFTVKNIGQETLEIRRVSTSCSCTTAKIDKEKIEPSETANLLVVYDSGAMKHETGKIERIIYIKSNDPINPQLEVTIYASVK